MTREALTQGMIILSKLDQLEYALLGVENYRPDGDDKKREIAELKARIEELEKELEAL